MKTTNELFRLWSPTLGKDAHGYRVAANAALAGYNGWQDGYKQSQRAIASYVAMRETRNLLQLGFIDNARRTFKRLDSFNRQQRPI